VRAQAAHRLRFAGDAIAAGLVEPFGLDLGEGNVAVEGRVVREVDPFLATLAQELLDGVAVVREGRRCGGRLEVCYRGGGGSAAGGKSAIGSGEEVLRVFVLAVERSTSAASR
jgi:hypothetical protein